MKLLIIIKYHRLYYILAERKIMKTYNQAISASDCFLTAKLE